MGRKGLRRLAPLECSSQEKIHKRPLKEGSLFHFQGQIIAL